MTAGPLLPREAATVVVARPAPAGFEVLLLTRHPDVPFMGGLTVFPGGKLEVSDLALAQAPHSTRAREVAAAQRPSPGRALDEQHGLALMHAACREAGEEAGLELRVEDLAYWAHWITPSAETRRFDTRFYLGRVAAGAEVVADSREATSVCWLTPAEALAANVAGRLVLAPPTLWTLEELLVPLTLDEAWGRPPVVTGPIVPKLVSGEEGPLLLLPWDRDYIDAPGEAGPRVDRSACHPRGASRMVAAGGRWGSVALDM